MDKTYKQNEKEKEGSVNTLQEEKETCIKTIA